MPEEAERKEKFTRGWTIYNNRKRGGGEGKRHSRMDNRLMISFIVVKNRMNKCELLTVSLLGPNSFRIFSFRGKVDKRLENEASYLKSRLAGGIINFQGN